MMGTDGCDERQRGLKAEVRVQVRMMRGEVMSIADEVMRGWDE